MGVMNVWDTETETWVPLSEGTGGVGLGVMNVWDTETETWVPLSEGTGG